MAQRATRVARRTAEPETGGYCYFPALLGGSAEDLYRVPVPAGAAPAGDGGASGAAGGSGDEPPAPERISLVPGRLEILLAPRVDAGFISWACYDQVFSWKPGSGDPTQVAVTTDSLQPSETSPPRSVLIPMDGTLYWVGGPGTLFKQQLPDGMRTRIAYKAANSLALDATYVYAAAGANVFRYPR